MRSQSSSASAASSAVQLLRSSRSTLLHLSSSSETAGGLGHSQILSGNGQLARGVSGQLLAAVRTSLGLFHRAKGLFEHILDLYRSIPRGPGTMNGNNHKKPRWDCTETFLSAH